MSLDIHPEARARLLKALGEHLGELSVNFGMFLNRLSFRQLFLDQRILPQSGALHDKLRKYVGEAPLVDFVNGVISRELFDKDAYTSDAGPRPLSELPGYSDSGALAERLLNEFESLPWQYTLTMALPRGFSDIFCKRISNMQLSSHVSVHSGTDFLRDNYPLESGIEKRDRSISGGGLLGLLGDQKAKWDAGLAYLQVRTEGFIGKFVDTDPMLEALALIRAFLGLAIATRIFKIKYSYQPHVQRERIYVHRLVSDRWIVEEAHDLESHYSQTLRDLVLDDLGGVLDDEATQASWMRRQLDEIGSVFRAQEDANKLVLGAQWLFDSHCGNDQLLQFVQAAVVMEILLGDKAISDLTGLGVLLANRCAYLIADSHSQREEVLKDFRKIYEVRSRIVHRGQSRLTNSESDLFSTLRWMARRVIQAEIKLLLQDSKR
jgi:hypothetical protein